MEQFHARKLRADEALSLYIHELKKLLEQAMPELTDDSTRTQLVLHQFLAGIPEDISRQIRAMGAVTTLDQAAERARLLMDVNVPKSPHQAAAIADGQESQSSKLEEQIAALTEQVAALSARVSQSGNQQRQRMQCFKCGRFGHTQRENTRDNRRCYKCGRLGHLARNCCQGNDQGMPTWGSGHPRQQ